MRTVKDMGSDFLFQCQTNYLEGIRPANEESRGTNGYKRLVELANEFFRGNKIEEFAGFFWEAQYSVNLWTAHLIIDYGSPNKELLEECVEVIKRYANTPLSEILAKEEKDWLIDNGYVKI